MELLSGFVYGRIITIKLSAYGTPLLHCDALDSYETEHLKRLHRRDESRAKYRLPCRLGRDEAVPNPHPSQYA